MRVGALVLGIIGGIIGLFAAVFALGVGGIGSAFETEGASTVVGLGWSALLLSILGIIGGALALAKPRFAALLMLVAGIGGFISVSLFYIIAGPLLLVGSLLAFLGRSPRGQPLTTA